MLIALLSDQLASQIAAGEVVERPVSVVKELVENALDAGATQINIEIREGGRDLIQVADDGQGIPAAEVEIAFLRHATSKLRAVADLAAIGTLGFRGEALAAIAAVSRVTMVTRAAAEAAGTRLTMVGSEVTGRDVVGAPEGTVIAVKDLFFNVPARLKFLKSVTSERRQIDEFVSRYALAYPNVRFRLSHNSRITFQTPGNGQLRDALVAVYGPDTARDLLPLLPAAPAGSDPAERQGVTVTGFAGPPSLHWSNRTHITLFVNGRWIKDTQITYAVVQAYHTLLPTGRYPMAVVFIDVPLDQVDVNVHPAKTEVRFRHPGSVFSAVQRAIRETLVATSPIRAVTTPAPDQMPTWQGHLRPSGFSRGADWDLHVDWATQFDERGQPPLGLARPPAPWPKETETAAAAPANLGGDRLPLMRVVGQVGASYIVTEGPDGMFLIDQHAAHERILYEQFMADWDDSGLATQGLVTGVVVHLPPAQAALLAEHQSALIRIGFEIDAFGPNAFKVRGVPALLGQRIDPERALRDVVEDLERGDAPLQGRIEAKIVLRVCKSAAVKAGQTLSQAEMEAMVQHLEACASPHTCPHGRPTLIHLSVANLARQFGRI